MSEEQVLLGQAVPSSSPLSLLVHCLTDSDPSLSVLASSFTSGCGATAAGGSDGVMRGMGQGKQHDTTTTTDKSGVDAEGGFQQQPVMTTAAGHVEEGDGLDDDDDQSSSGSSMGKVKSEGAGHGGGNEEEEGGVERKKRRIKAAHDDHTTSLTATESLGGEEGMADDHGSQQVSRWCVTVTTHT